MQTVIHNHFYELLFPHLDLFSKTSELFILILSQGQNKLNPLNPRKLLDDTFILVRISSTEGMSQTVHGQRKGG